MSIRRTTTDSVKRILQLLLRDLDEISDDSSDSDEAFEDTTAEDAEVGSEAADSDSSEISGSEYEDDEKEDDDDNDDVNDDPESTGDQSESSGEEEDTSSDSSCDGCSEDFADLDPVIMRLLDPITFEHRVSFPKSAKIQSSAVIALARRRQLDEVLAYAWFNMILRLDDDCYVGHAYLTQNLALRRLAVQRQILRDTARWAKWRGIKYEQLGGTDFVEGFFRKFLRPPNDEESRVLANMCSHTGWAQDALEDLFSDERDFYRPMETYKRLLQSRRIE